MDNPVPPMDTTWVLIESRELSNCMNGRLTHRFNVRYPYGLSQNNAYNRVPAGYSAYSSTAQPHHLMSMGASSATQSSHDVDIPREPYIPPSNTGNGS